MARRERSVMEGFADRWPMTTATIFGLAMGVFFLMSGIGGAWVLDQIGVF